MTFNFIVLAYRFYYTSQWQKALFCLHRLQWRNSESGKIPFTVHRCLPDGRRVWTDFVFITVHSTYLLSLSIVICGSVHSYEDWGVDELIVEDSWKQQVAGDWVVFSLVFSVPIFLPGLSFAACWYLETQLFSIVLWSQSFFFPLEFDGNCHLWKCGLSRDTNWYCAYGNRQVWTIFIFSSFNFSLFSVWLMVRPIYKEWSAKQGKLSTGQTDSYNSFGIPCSCWNLDYVVHGK